MISLPLDDFRHVSHIGNGGQNDSFGDLSFLKMGHGLIRQSSKSEQNLFLSCKPPPKPPRLNLDGTESMQSPEWSVDQKRKKCNSLPLLDSEEEDKCENEEEDERRNNFSSSQTRRPGRGSVGSERDGEFTGSCDHIDRFKDEDSGFAFSLDLGPSILEDVLRVMDKLHNWWSLNKLQHKRSVRHLMMESKLNSAFFLGLNIWLYNHDEIDDMYKNGITLRLKCAGMDVACRGSGRDQDSAESYDQTSFSLDLNPFNPVQWCLDDEQTESMCDISQFFSGG